MPKVVRPEAAHRPGVPSGGRQGFQRGLLRLRARFEEVDQRLVT